MNESSKTVPPLLLEKALLNELTAVERSALSQRLDLAAEKKFLAELDQQSEAFLRGHSPRTEAAVIARRIAGTSRRPKVASRVLWSSTLLAAAASIFFVVTRPRHDDVMLPVEDHVILKGLEPDLKLYTKTLSGFASVQKGDLLKNGDVVQLRYRAAGLGYGVIVSLDGRGQVTLHFPLSPDGDTSLKAGGEVALNHAYELDDAPRFERFVLVAANHPLDPNQIVRAAETLVAAPDRARDTPLPLPEDVKQIDLVVRKAP